MEMDRPGTKQQFYLRFLAARAELGLRDPAAVSDEIALNTCPKCEQPTTNEGECTFCRTWEHVNARLAEST
jgi:hypothetical protein